MNYTDSKGVLIMVSRYPSEYTSFLNNFISEISQTEIFTLFGDCENLHNSENEIFFTPWRNQDYEPPHQNFSHYQNTIAPVLNQFIEIKNHTKANIVVPYPLDNDSEGNRFVLKSLIDLAFQNKKSNEWLIFTYFNYSDFEILNHISKHLAQNNKIAILIDDESQIDQLIIGTKELITANNRFKVIQFSKNTIKESIYYVDHSSYDELITR